MTLTPTQRRVLLAVAVLLFLGLAWNGLSGGIQQASYSRTPGEIAQTTFEFAFGVFALLSVLTTFWAQRWIRVMLVGWTVSTTLAAGLATVVWGKAPLLIGVVSAVAGFLIAAGLAWLLQVGARGLTRV